MKKILLACLCVVFGGMSVLWAGTCNLSTEELLANPDSESWCELACLDKIVHYVDTHSRNQLSPAKDSLTKGVVRGRRCATAYVHDHGQSPDYWNDMVDRQNYIYHQAGMISSRTESSVNADGSSHEACQASSESGHRPLFYGGAILSFYMNGMSELDKRVVFTNLICVYRLESQMGRLSVEHPHEFYALIQDGKHVSKLHSGPLTGKVIANIFDKMERHVTGCNPEVKKPREENITLDEVVVIGTAPKKEPLVPTLETVISQKVKEGVCTLPEDSQKGNDGLTVSSALEGNGTGNGNGNGNGNGQGNGNGNGDGDMCPVQNVNGITVFIPCRRK